MGVVAVAGLAWAAWSQRDAIAAFDWSADRGRLALAVALFAVAPLLQALTFALGLRRIGADGPASALVRDRFCCATSPAARSGSSTA
jgi:hypothetical protein